MTLLLGDVAPNFVAATTEGEIDFHRWKGDSWAVLFSHPADFTPVCTTELGEAARLKPEFERRGSRLIGLSLDAIDDHERWNADIEMTQGTGLNFPLIADSADSVATKYGMVHPRADSAMTVRTTFVIDPANVIRLTTAYPPEIGRSFSETLRVLDALRLGDGHGVVSPVEWRRGERVIVSPAIDDETALERFGGFDAQRPYLRYVDDPCVAG